MVVTVKAAKTKIDELQAHFDDFMKLQNYALYFGLPEYSERSEEDQKNASERCRILEKIRTEADLVQDIRTLGTIGCDLCRAEIKRIESIIDGSKISI